MDDTHGVNERRGPLIGLTFVLLLLVFWLTTPFDFSWPVKFTEGYYSTTDVITFMERGNMGRRIGMLLLAALAILSLAKTKNRFRFNMPAGWILLFYLGWMLFSLSWSIDVPFTLRRVVTVDILWLAAIAAAARYSLRELAFLTVLVTGTTLVLGVANELRLHTIDPTNEMWRFSGIFHTVVMGWNCGLLALAAMFLAHCEERKNRRFIFWCIFIVAVIVLLLTKTRGGVVATLIGVFYYRYRVVSVPNKLLLMLGVIITVCLAYLTVGNLLLYYGEEASTLGRGEIAKESVSDLTGRIPLWKECFNWSAERPFLGYGFNSFVSPKNIETITRNVGWMPTSVHSGYMDSLMGLGYPGALALIFLLLTALVRAFKLSAQYPEYIFVISVLLWFYINLVLVDQLITRPSFMSFFCMTLLARLALLPGPEWERS